MIKILFRAYLLVRGLATSLYAQKLNGFDLL
jgi:hypothetical protein